MQREIRMPVDYSKMTTEQLRKALLENQSKAHAGLITCRDALKTVRAINDEIFKRLLEKLK
jgi:hypothetical protein